MASIDFVAKNLNGQLPGLQVGGHAQIQDGKLIGKSIVIDSKQNDQFNNSLQFGQGT